MDQVPVAKLLSVPRMALLIASFFGLLSYHYSHFLLGPAYLIADELFYLNFIKDVSANSVLSAGLSLLTYGVFSVFNAEIIGCIYRASRGVFGDKKSRIFYRNFIVFKKILLLFFSVALFSFYFGLISTGSPFFIFTSIIYLAVAFMIGGSLAIFKSSLGRRKTGKKNFSASKKIDILRDFALYSFAFFAFFFSFHLAGGIAEATVSRSAVLMRQVGSEELVIIVGRTELGVFAIDKKTRSEITFVPFEEIESIEWKSNLYRNRGLMKILN